MTALLLVLAMMACGPVEDIDDPQVDDEPTVDDCEGAALWYFDLDRDGYGDPLRSEERCEGGFGWTLDASDCDDTDPAVNPAAAEVCNGFDDDCDGEADVVPTWYLDVDGDGWGAEAVVACDAPPEGVDLTGDCDDDNPDVHPDAFDHCNGLDDDCDGQLDEEGGIPWCVDRDFDGFGDPRTQEISCAPPDELSVDDCSDCNDESAATYPGAWDGCDGEDNDCDGGVDEDHKADWALISGGDRVFYEVDRNDASLRELAHVDDPMVITATDVREDGAAFLHDDVEGRVSTFDACTGQSWHVGHTGLGRVDGMAFGQGDTLYLLDEDSDTLARMDTRTGATTTLGALGEDFESSGLAFDCSTDAVFALNSRDGGLYELSTSDGSARQVLETGLELDAVGLEYDAARGLLLASTGQDLYEIHLDGAVHHLGHFDVTIDDLTLYPRCED